MNAKKGSLVIIIILLIIFLPLTVLGYFYKENNTPKSNNTDNPNMDFFYEGKLWFYDNNDNLLSTYACETEVCRLAVPTIDDADYNINYYNGGILEEVPIMGDFAFIEESDFIKLYTVSSGKVLQTYKRIKTYNTGIENDLVILENEEGLWGVLQMGEQLTGVLPFEYSFIGIKNMDLVGDYLPSEKFIVKKEDNWYVMDKTGNILTGYINNPIVDYNSNYLITMNNNEYKILDYEGNEYLGYKVINKYYLYNEYIITIGNSLLDVYKDVNEPSIKSGAISNIDSEITFDTQNGEISVYVDGVAI